MALFLDSTGQLVVAASMPVGGSVVASAATSNLVDTAPWFRSLDDGTAQWHPANYYASGGESALVIDGRLTLGAVTIPAANDGTTIAGNFSLATGTFNVFLGTLDVTSACSFAVDSSTNLTASINASTGIYAATAMPTANDSGAVTFSATYKGQVIKLTFIVTKSKSGANGSSISGANGISTYTVDMYLAVNQASTPTAPAGGTYNFGTKVFTPPNANWTLTQPASSTVPTWACTYTFFTTNSPTETVTAGTWTNVRTVAQNGASIQGNAGNSAVRVFAFNASSGTPPTAPSGNITTALPATPVADTWYTSPITLAVNKFQWQCDGIKDASTTTWASPYLSVFKVDTLAAFVVNTGALTVSDKLTIGANGKIASGQTAYDTGKGFWLESSGKFSVGDSAGKKIAFDGSTLTLNGELVLNGNLSTNAVSTVKIAANQVTENTITTAGFTSLNIPANSGSASNSTTVINMFTFPSVDISTVRPVLVQFTLEHFDTTAGYISVNCAGNSIVTDVPVRLTDGSNVTTFTFLFNVTIAANTTSASGGLVITLNNGATANYWNATSPPAVSNVKLLVMTGKR